VGAESKRVPDRILDAAIETLATSGLPGLTQVAVAAAAGVRQSHLTYYFPRREDLLEAVAGRAVGEIACEVGRAVELSGSLEDLLAQLVESVAGLDHMRMFVSMIVEADGDPAVREIMMLATRRMEALLADMLEAGDGPETARLVLAAAWGLGLYRFLMRPGPEDDHTGAYLSWLARATALLSEASPTRRGTP
jgi:AcrR family transcriptional regulator